MGNEQSTAKMISIARQKNETALSVRGELLENKWIPDNAATLELQTLKLIDMGMQLLPNPLFFITSLTRLDLSLNQIVSVSGIGLLSELQYLDLTQNKLDYLPDDICQLVKLKELKVAKNNLTARSIPTDLFTAPISLLDLSENKLTKLPLDLVYELCKLSTVLLHGNNWSAPELQRITSNSPQEDIKLVLTIYTETMAKNATMPVETREQGEKKKTIAENVGGFLARKLSIGKGNPKKSEEPESVPEPKILKPKATKQDNADEVEAFIAPAPEPKPKPVRAASAKSDPVEEPESNSEPKILKPPKLAKGDQKSGSKSNSLDTAAESPSEKVSLSSATSPRSPGTIAPVLVQDPVKLPERTAAPLKQHSRAAGPKGRKPPSAEFISQNIQEEVVIAKDSTPTRAIEVKVQATSNPEPATREEIARPKPNKKVMGMPLAGLMSELKAEQPKEVSPESDTLELPPQLPPKSTKPASRSGSQVRPSTASGPEQRPSTIESVVEVAEKDETAKVIVPPPVLTKPRKQTESRPNQAAIVEQEKPKEVSSGKNSVVRPPGPQFDLSELKNRQQKQQDEHTPSPKKTTMEPEKAEAKSTVKEILKPNVTAAETPLKPPAKMAEKEQVLPPRPVRTDSSTQITENLESKPQKPNRPMPPQFDIAELKHRQEKSEDFKNVAAESPVKPELIKSDSTPTRMGLDQSALQAQLKAQLGQKIPLQSNVETSPAVPLRPKKSDLEKSQDKLNNVPALPPKIAAKPTLEHSSSQKNIPSAKEAESTPIPPWKQELERRKQQQT